MFSEHLSDSLVTRNLEMLYQVVLVVAVGMGEGMGGMSRVRGLKVRNEIHCAVLTVVVS